MSSSSFPTTMRAITITKAGGVEVIELTDEPFPQSEPGHVIVKVQYAGLNYIDTYFRSGLYPIKTFPHTLGMESAGVVVRLPTDPAILESEDFKESGLREGARVAARNPGSMAEYVSLPWWNANVLPDSVSTLVGAASVLQGLTALTFMNEAYDVKKGDTILVHTVAGGLGLIFAQIGKARGARVIGTTSTKEKAELAKQHGADEVVLYKDEDTVQRVLDLTGGKGVDAVFDGVGKDTFESNFRMLKRKGTLVSVGNASGPVPPFPPLKLTDKNLKLCRPSLNNYCVTPEEVLKYTQELYGMIVSGVVKINVHKVYPFSPEGVQGAHSDLTGGKSTGKLLIKISDD